ncbi:P-loop NTPase fold protein [Klebsiella pneumoniae]
MSITKILDEFLASDDRVAVIKGEWGVGKTHFWNRYYKVKEIKEKLIRLHIHMFLYLVLILLKKLRKNYSLPLYRLIKNFIERIY